MKHKHALMTVGSALVVVLASATSGLAQVVPSPTLRIGAGFADYDLSGTGNTGSATVGFDYPVANFLSVTASTDYFAYSQDSLNSHRYLLPELGVQAFLPGSRISPYVGLGAGYAWQVSGDGGSDPTLFAAVGSRFALRPGLGAWVEGRVRSIDPWVGSTAEIKIGLSKAL